MINGAHVIIYSKSGDADRAFLKDVIGLPSVDVGGGWLIFGLPISEVAVHPAETSESHELYFMVEDVEEFATKMRGHGIAVAEITNQGWGLLTSITLPGGGKLGVYQPRHARPKQMVPPGPAKKKTAKKTAKKAAKATKKPVAKKAAKKAPKKASKKASARR